jgi:hypothetical protein
MEHIPHQLGLKRSQISKAIKGHPFQISHKQMGSGAGDVVMMLHPHNAKKLLSSYRKGKGVRMTLTPEEINHSIHHGRGFFKSLRRMGSEVLANPVVKTIAKKGARYGADAIGTAVGTAIGDPATGAMIGKMVGNEAEKAIDRHKAKVRKASSPVEAKEMALEAVEKQVDKLPMKYRAVAEEALHSAEDLSTDRYMERKRKEMGLGMKDLMKNIGKAVHKSRHMSIGDAGDALKNMSVGDAVGHAREITGLGMRPKKGSPEMKAYMAKIRGMRGKKMKGEGVMDDIKKGLKKVSKYAIPATTGAIGSALGAVAGGPLGGVAGSTLGTYAGDEINRAIGNGVKRGRGRPRKGAGAMMSAPYKQALKLNKMTYGVELNNMGGENEPVSKFKVNPKVKPSSDEMTLSPYQSINSPAMNPFIPINYQQEGGQSCGYGQAVPYSNIYGRGMKRGKGLAKMGVGLYAGGLY